MSSKLKLFFFHSGTPKIKKYKLSFRDIIEDINNDNLKISTYFSIPDFVFKHGKDKTAIGITLYDDSNNSNNYKFNVYYGKNSAYVQTDNFSDYVFEIIFRNMKYIKIEENGMEFKELDNLDNKNRERLCLINYYNHYIHINGIKFNLSLVVSKNTSVHEITFNQISVLDLEKEKFIVQPIREKSEYNVKFLNDKKNLFNNFETKYFNKFFNSGANQYQTILDQIIDKFIIIQNHGSLDLNRDNNYLNEIFSKNTFLDLNLFFNYSLCKFFLDRNDYVYLFYKGRVILNFVKKIKNIKAELSKIKELPIYEKVRVVYSLFAVFLMTKEPFANPSDIENLNLRYYITKKRGINSILDRSYNLYESFINNISEDSAIFPYLLNIDGGIGYYEKEDVYTFDLKNLDMIKNHLRQVYPEVIIFCYIEDGEVALTESEFGGIIINEFYLTKVKNLDYNSSTLSQITEEEKDDIAVNIFLDNIHEASGHKKFALSEEGLYSPRKFVNKNNEIITLEHKNDYDPKKNNIEYILTNNKTDKGDSGHYLELCYGKYNNRLIIDILRNMKNKGKLIRYPRLFTDDLKTLNEYVSLRQQIEENNIKFNSNYEASIDDDIILMRKEIEAKKIQNNNLIEQISNINEPNQNVFLNQGKRKRDGEDTENNNELNDYSKNKMKKYEANFIKSNIMPSSKSIKEGDKKDFIYDEEKQEPERFPTRAEMLEKAKKRVAEHFNFDFKSNVKMKLKKLIEELDVKNPYYHDVGFLLSDCYIKY